MGCIIRGILSPTWSSIATMDIDPRSILQPPLFVFGEAVTGTVELFPAVWSATEALAAPDVASRNQGLDRLLELEAPRLSPLVAYMLASRLSDPDVYIRRRVVYILGDLLVPDAQGRVAPESVRRYVTAYLSQMRTRSIYNLLEVAVNDPQAEKSICQLLNASPYAGRHMADILIERKNPLLIRQNAVRFIGLVGYLDALPVLERMVSRLEARQHGQQAMSFAPPTTPSEEDFLPYLHEAIKNLRAP
jgi:HEAT repeat protein